MGSVQDWNDVLSVTSKTDVQKRHAARIQANLIEMRRCLRASEEARDAFNAIKGGYKERKGLSRGELAAAMDSDFDAKVAIADSQLYDRWTSKYAAVVAAELEAYRAGIHANNWSKLT